MPLDFRTRLPALDGIRALAVTMVFLEHYGGGSHGGPLLQWINQVRLRGWVGVDIFFVLSGFLITGILYDTLGDSHYMKRFFARRSLRILPLYYGVFILLGILTPLVGYLWRPRHLWFLVYLGNIVGDADFSLYHVISAKHPSWSANLGHLWSLCVEEQFYLVWPWVVAAVKRRERLIAIATSLIVATPFIRYWFFLWAKPPFGEQWIVRALPFRMDALLIGAVLALLLRGPNAARVQRWCPVLFFVAASAFVAMTTWMHRDALLWMMTYGLSLTALAAAGLIGTVAKSGGLLFRFFTLKPLRRLGQYSYGFYVFHELFYLAWLAFLNWAAARWHSLALAGILELGLAFATTLLISRWSYLYVESRFLRLKTRFEYDVERASHRHAFRA